MRFSLRDKTIEICFSLQVDDSTQCGFPDSRYKKKHFRAVGYSRRAVCCKTKWPQRVPPASHAIDLALTMRPRANGRHGTSCRSGPRAPRDNGLASPRQPRAKPSCPTGTHPRDVCEIVQSRPRCVRRRSTRGYTPDPSLHMLARSPKVCAAHPHAFHTQAPGMSTGVISHGCTRSAGPRRGLDRKSDGVRARQPKLA